MKLISVHTLLPKIVPLLNGCNDDLANIILADAARTFARESDIVIETRGFADYEAPAYGRMPEFALEPDKFVPLHFICRQEDRESKRVYVTYSMLPIAEFMPESVIVRNYEAITSQALFQLYNMPGKPWSNPQMAELNYNKYRIALGDAIRDNVTGGAVFDQAMVCLDIGDMPYVGEQNVTATVIGTDTSDGNLAPSKMLAGAVGYSKGERVEGDIDTVTPQVNANTFSVESGFVATAVKHTIPESTITDDGNNIIVTSGYVGTQQSIPKGGSDIDLSGVTVTADKLLAGVVAVDGSGSKITGTIPEVTASKSGKTVTVPAGHHAKKQEFTFEEAPINLSFVTATASDILTGKVGADKNGNPVTGALVIPSVPEAPDLSVVTVTADTMLKGKVAVNSAGQKITGTIETVTASWRSEGLVIVPVGYVAEAQTVTIPVMSEVSFVGDSVLIPSGYNKDSHRVPMPKGEVTVTDNQIWISPGYIENKIITVPEAEALTVSGNKVTVPVGYIKVERTAEIPVVSATLTDNKVTIPAGYNNGQTLTVAEAAAPSVSGNVVTVNKGYLATEKKITVGTARESTTITPSTAWKQIPADTYCTGTQYIAGDENLVPENIAEGVSIFNVQGTHKGGGGGGGGEFYKCAAVYGPYDVETVVISGCPVADANGEYLPTDQTTSDWEGKEYPVYANGKGWYYGYSEYGGWGITQDFNNGLKYQGKVGSTWHDWDMGGEISGMTAVNATVTLNANVPKTWDGYKAVYADGFYSFEDTVTVGLNYGNSFVPSVGNIYSKDCHIMVRGLWSDGYSFLRFEIDANNGENVVQLSEIVLFDALGKESKWSDIGIKSVKIDPSVSPSEGEGADKLFDDLYTTKFCASSFSGSTWVQIELDASVSLRDFPRYGWYTANDYPARDPKSWTFLASKDGINWDVIDKQTNVAVTDSRNALVGVWEFDQA